MNEMRYTYEEEKAIPKKKKVVKKILSSVQFFRVKYGLHRYVFTSLEYSTRVPETFIFFQSHIFPTDRKVGTVW